MPRQCHNSLAHAHLQPTLKTVRKHTRPFLTEISALAQNAASKDANAFMCGIAGRHEEVASVRSIVMCIVLAFLSMEKQNSRRRDSNGLL